MVTVRSFKRLTLRVRKRLPEPVRHLLRLNKHLVPNGKASGQLPPALLANCRMYASRKDLVRALPRTCRIVEVGTLHGDFARFILATSAPRNCI